MLDANTIRCIDRDRLLISPGKPKRFKMLQQGEGAVHKSCLHTHAKPSLEKKLLASSGLLYVVAGTYIRNYVVAGTYIRIK